MGEVGSGGRIKHGHRCPLPAIATDKLPSLRARRERGSHRRRPRGRPKRKRLPLPAYVASPIVTCASSSYSVTNDEWSRSPLPATARESKNWLTRADTG